MAELDSRRPLDPRLLAILQELLREPALDVRSAMTAAAECVLKLLDCEKVDAFILDEAKKSLVALGTSRSPLGDLQKSLGLDFMPLANGGSVVRVFNTGVPYATGRSDLDPEELHGVVGELGIRSQIAVALDVNGARTGVLSAVSRTPDFFDANDQHFLELVAQWVGMLAHRAELVDAVRRTEARNARRVVADELITVLAHDLRNHIQPLLGRLHLMKLRADEGRPPQADDVEKALLSAERLSRMTADLLDVARLDQGLFALKTQIVNLGLLAQEVALALSVPKVAVQVDAPNDLTVIGDQDRLRQALENVVANAIKHSPTGATVRVTATFAGENARLDVMDQGPGIPPDVLPRIFERYVAGTGSSGLGLGLYLASQIAVSHGGSLSAESAVGRGARFRFVLPRG